MTPSALRRFQVEVLVEADRFLRLRQPAMRVHFRWLGNRCQARFEYPGRVLVYWVATGELLACSRLGRPTTPASIGRRRQST